MRRSGMDFSVDESAGGNLSLYEIVLYYLLNVSCMNKTVFSLIFLLAFCFLTGTEPDFYVWQRHHTSEVQQAVEELNEIMESFVRSFALRYGIDEEHVPVKTIGPHSALVYLTTPMQGLSNSSSNQFLQFVFDVFFCSFL